MTAFNPEVCRPSIWANVDRETDRTLYMSEFRNGRVARVDESFWLERLAAYQPYGGNWRGDLRRTIQIGWFVGCSLEKHVVLALTDVL